jgi:saccharopine dehydrogenase-like NADP-dependent oxidoreductase
VSRILVLGGSGEMGSAAVADLVERTGHEVTIGDVRPEAAAELLRRLGAPERVVRVDVDDTASLAAALDGTEVVLNATYMRHNVPVTDAAIAAGAHLVDLGSYYPETLQQLDRHAAAERAGCRIVPGCGVAPGLTNILARLGADRLDRVESVRIYSYITHPLWTSPGIVVTRFDASSGTSLVYEGGRLVERASFGGEQPVVFPEPYGEQEVHLVPHPEPVTLPRSIDLRNVVFKVGYPADETRRIRLLMELGFDSDEPFHVDGVRGGKPLTLAYDFAVERTGRSASSAITGTVAAVAADLVARGGATGVHPPEAAFDPRRFLDALADRGLAVSERELR